MYIHLGRDYVLNDRDIIGIFNLETTTISPRGREFLNYAQKNGAVAADFGYHQILMYFCLDK